MSNDPIHSKGMKVRRAILGDAHVDKAVKNTTELDREFQDFLTRYAWGEVWDRPGLSQSTRRLLTIAMLVALGNEDELRLHVRAAIAAGLSPDELKEVLLQSALYCGLPAANKAFHIAKELLEEASRS